MGPFNQFKKMFASTRLIATILVITSITLTLVAALYVSTFSLLSYLLVPSENIYNIFLFLVAQSWFSSVIYNYSVTSYDMVFFVIYTICS